jgi:hypothetical protein
MSNRKVWIVEGQSLANSHEWFPLLGWPVAWNHEDAKKHAREAAARLGFKTRAVAYTPQED